MESGGISRRLISFSSSLVGHIRGGLSMISIVAAMFFAGISGSTAADTAAIGSVLIPAMEQKGYGKDLATSVVGTAGAIGIIIPPSSPWSSWASREFPYEGSSSAVCSPHLRGWNSCHKRVYARIENSPLSGSDLERGGMPLPIHPGPDDMVILMVGILSGVFTARRPSVVRRSIPFSRAVVYGELKWRTSRHYGQDGHNYRGSGALHCHGNPASAGSGGGADPDKIARAVFALSNNRLVILSS